MTSYYKKSTCSTILISLVCLLSSCAVFKNKYNRDLINKSILGSELFASHFTGFTLYDPVADEYIYSINGDKYFTPASNTKLFTFYSALKLMNDSVPALKYIISGDSLIFWGTGDPTFLHPDFPDQPVFEFLKTSDRKLFYATGNFQDKPFGSGWAWDDYEFYFQPERSAFPMYGNVISFTYDSIQDQEVVTPGLFRDYVEIDPPGIPTNYPRRHQRYNIFSYQLDSSKSAYKNRVPFQTSYELVKLLLEDTLKKTVGIIPYKAIDQGKTVYSRPKKAVLSRMLKSSDNFLAEQLLYSCAANFTDTLNSASIRNYILKDHLSAFNQKPIWRDGSGLSRYNLFTPKSLVQLLKLIHQSIPESDIPHYFPIGGVDGTLKSWYLSDSDEPYIYAKQGRYPIIIH